MQTQKSTSIYDLDLATLHTLTESDLWDCIGCGEQHAGPVAALLASPEGRLCAYCADFLGDECTVCE